METLGTIFEKYFPVGKLTTTKVTRRNPNYEAAEEFGKYIGVSPLFVLKLFKKYGKNKVLGLRSWIADYPFDPKKGKCGLLIWKLSQK